jgi:hypothetical protein
VEQRVCEAYVNCNRSVLSEAFMHKVSLKSSLLILVLALSAYGQGTIDQNGVYFPTEEEIARNKAAGRIVATPRHSSAANINAT